jgi:hypothetical protein
LQLAKFAIDDWRLTIKNNNIMKKILILIITCLLCTTLWAQQSPLDQFFDKYGSDTSFTIINISPKMFNLFSQVDLDTGDPQAQEIMDVAQKLTGLRIITKDHVSNGTQLFHEAANMLSNKYEELMTIRDHGNDMKFLIKQGNNGIIHELVMLVGGEDEFFAMSLTGDIDLNEISKIAGSMNIQGFDKLKDVKDKRQ